MINRHSLLEDISMRHHRVIQHPQFSSRGREKRVYKEWENEDIIPTAKVRICRQAKEEMDFLKENNIGLNEMMRSCLFYGVRVQAFMKEVQKIKNCRVYIQRVEFPVTNCKDRFHEKPIPSHIDHSVTSRNGQITISSGSLHPNSGNETKVREMNYSTKNSSTDEGIQKELQPGCTDGDFKDSFSEGFVSESKQETCSNGQIVFSQAGSQHASDINSGDETTVKEMDYSTKNNSTEECIQEELQPGSTYSFKDSFPEGFVSESKQETCSNGQIVFSQAGSQHSSDINSRDETTVKEMGYSIKNNSTEECIQEELQPGTYSGFKDSFSEGFDSNSKQETCSNGQFVSLPAGYQHASDIHSDDEVMVCQGMDNSTTNNSTEKDIPGELQPGGSSDSDQGSDCEYFIQDSASSELAAQLILPHICPSSPCIKVRF